MVSNRPPRRGDRIRRRDVIAGLLFAVTMRRARAQQAGRTYKVAIVTSLPRSHPYHITLFDELRRHGFIEGENLSYVGAFDVPFPPYIANAEPAAVEAAKASPDVIVTGGASDTRMWQRVTRTIPIVTISDDLIGQNLVASFAHPEGNTTGISILATELDGKRQGLLMEMLPDVRRIAALADLAAAPPEHLSALENDARSRGIELSVYKVGGPNARYVDQIVSAIEQMRAAGIQGLNVLASAPFHTHRAHIIERTIAARIPAIFQWPDYAAWGGLVGYGPRLTSVWRQQARQVVRVLRGARPADIPVEQPTNVELAINLTTAKTLGVTIPPAILARADEVIE
jgi:putative ABC transport system substrate-binding protein